MNDVLLKRVLYGISCRNYEAAAEAIPGAIGLSGSTVSRGFIQASAAKLRELQERDLSGEDVVAVVLDGKTFAEATMVIALGITIAGGKRFLGFVETDTENERVLTRDLAAVTTHPRPANRHLPAAQHDLAGRMTRPRGAPVGLMRIPRTAHAHAILLQHRLEDLQARRDDQRLELGLRIDQDVDQRQVPSCRRI